MDDLDFQKRLQTLLERFPHLGVTSDISVMTIDEQLGLYRFLMQQQERMEDGKITTSLCGN